MNFEQTATTIAFWQFSLKSPQTQKQTENMEQ